MPRCLFACLLHPFFPKNAHTATPCSDCPESAMKYKPLLLTALIITVLLLFGCSMVEAVSTPGGSNGFGTFVRQIGQPGALIKRDGVFTYIIVYPDCDEPALDTALELWAGQAVNFAVGRRTMSEDGRDGGTLRIEYESYYSGDRYIGVVESGSYVSTGSAGPERLAKIFNYDAEQGRLLAPVELIPYAMHPQMLDLLNAKLASEHPAIAAGLTAEEGWLESFVLAPDGVYFMLYDRGIPGDKLVFSYDELAGLLILPHELDSYEWTLGGDPDAPVGTPEDEAPAARVIDPEKPMIALTFDDGPGDVTGTVLDILKLHNVPATFFIIGRQVGDYPELLARMVEQQCEVAIHTWSHPQLTKQKKDDIASQITMTADAIEQACGVRPVLIRPPYGAVNQTVHDVAAELGMYLINWSVDPLDWKNRNADKVYGNIMADTRDGRIILCHDLYSSTAEAVNRAIPELIAQGYQFVTVSELLSYSNRPVEAGGLYRQQ